MRRYANSLNLSIFNIVREVADKLDYPTFVVGGWVRDLIINKKSIKNDVDFVCVGNGLELAKAIADRLGSTAKLSVFKKFGTAMISHNNKNYEFVGARKESYRYESRKPIVEDGTLEDDQKRRDFTINAMAIQLNTENYGKFIDPFDGEKDLKDKIIRTCSDPDVTYSDDPLRMIRAIRFATQLNFNIEETSYKSIIKNHKRLDIISQERITEELNKIILSELPSKGFKLLFNTKLLPLFFPEMSQLQGVEYKDNYGHKDNFYHTIKVLDNISANTNKLWLRWAAILHDIGKPATKRYEENHGWTFHGHEFVGSKMTPRIFKKLRLPLNEKMKYVKKLVLLHLRPIVLAQEIVTDSAIRRLLFDAGNDIDDLMLLCEADITSKNEKKVNKYLKNFQLVRNKLKEVEEKDQIRNFQPPINGVEIMRLFNIEAGREIGILKNAIKDAILDGNVKNNKKEALRFIINKAKELNIKQKK